jgi:hypothetical protein
VTTGTLSVKVNNIQGPYFSTGKGARQGDPLSPFLFNIATDTLAKMMNGAQKNKLITSLVPEYLFYSMPMIPSCVSRIARNKLLI